MTESADRSMRIGLVCPYSLSVPGGVQMQVLAMARELRARGHAAEQGPDWSEGRLSAARREGAQMFAGANPRGMQGYAAGR